MFIKNRDKIIIVAFLLLILFSMSQAVFAQKQKKVTVSGYVRDAANGEDMVGATVYVPEISNGAATNLYGFYSISVEPGSSYTFQFSSLGYNTQNIKISNLLADTSMNIELVAEAVVTEEVVIEGKEEEPNSNVMDVSIGKIDVDVNQVKKLPALFGEPDIIKAVQTQPGVISAGEGTSAFFVRGGSADQNLILIDEAPVYDPSHLFGLFSVFNADVLKDVNLYKGGIPARYGGRLSSLLEIKTKDGNNKEFAGRGGLGLLSSKIMLEGPIKKDKSSFLLAGRRSYADLFLRLSPDEGINSTVLYFYDVNAKVNFRASNKDRFFVSAYLGRDVLDLDDVFGFSWGNNTVTARWNHLFNDKMFSNTTAIFSNFDYRLSLNTNGFGFDWTSNIRQGTIQEDIVYYINPDNALSFGYKGTYREFQPGRFEPKGAGERQAADDIIPTVFALDHALYVGNEQKVTSRLSLDYGLRLSIFQNIGEATIYEYSDITDRTNFERIDSTKYGAFETIKTFVRPEPRISARYILTENSSLKATYNRMVQNLHQISSGTVPIPFATWQPSSPYLEPQIADQVAAGYFRNFKNNEYEFSVEGYYKTMENVTDFADNAVLFFNQDLAAEYRQGDSEAYGAELFLKKRTGKLTGSASYTLSWVTRTIPGVNNSETFYSNYDRRNNFYLIGVYEIDDRFSAGAGFTYSTGRPITLPAGTLYFR